MSKSPICYGVFTLAVTETRTDREQMGCMKLCGSFYITPEPGQGSRPIVPYCSSPGPCALPVSVPVLLSVNTPLVAIAYTACSFSSTIRRRKAICAWESTRGRGTSWDEVDNSYKNHNSVVENTQ